MFKEAEGSQAPRLDYYMDYEELRKRHEEAKPPTEAYLFFPGPHQIVEYNEKDPKKTLRRIFESKTAEFLKWEDTKLKEFEEEIKKHNSKKKPEDRFFLPVDYKKEEVRRYLQATGFNCTKSLELLKENIRWRKELIPPKMNDKIMEILNCGFIYVHGRDNNYRPIMVLNANTYMKLKDKYPFEDWLNSVIVFMEYIIKNLLIPGQVENWNIITDLNGVSLVFFPSDMKKIMGVLQSNYRCRLYVNYLLGMGSILRGIWNIIKGMLDETTVRKVRILDDKNTSEIFTFIHEDQVEQRFGGKAKDVVPGLHNCFPPIMPSKHFLKNNQTKENVLISETEYKRRHLNGNLTVTGEYYVNKWGQEEENLKLKFEDEKREKEILEKKTKERAQTLDERENKMLNNFNANQMLKTDSITSDNIIIINPMTHHTYIESHLNSHRLVEELNLELEKEFNDTNKKKLIQFKTKYTKESVECHTKQYFKEKSFLSDKSPEVLMHFDKSIKNLN
jgi:hypothetical protein